MEIQKEVLMRLMHIPAIVLLSVLFVPGLAVAQHAFQPAASPGTCANTQLVITARQSSGSAGHIGIMYRIHNQSNRTCTLHGFPGVVLLDKGFNTLPTHVTWATNLAGHHPVQLVALSPQGNAYFLLYWAEIPTGNEACPAARYLMVTAPNDRLPDVLYAARGFDITPCGGRLMATPVEPAPFTF
jgi:hypothetical protein